MASVAKEELFERTPIPKAVASLSIPTIISSLVMVIYSMVDTYFVGLLNEPVQTAAVALAAPVLLAFNAVNNLFGVGSSSMDSNCLRLITPLFWNTSLPSLKKRRVGTVMILYWLASSISSSMSTL